MNSFKFGIVTDFFGIAHPIEKVLHILSKAGIKDVEIPGGHLAQDIANPPSLALSKNLKRLKNLKKLAGSLGIKIWQIHGPYGGSDLVATAENVRRKNIDTYKAWIDYSHELGAHALIIHIGGRNDFCDSKDIQFIKEKNIDSLLKLSNHIGSGNFKLAIENLPSRCMENPKAFNIFGNRLEDLLEIINETETEKIGMCIDVGHANIENWNIPAAIKKAGKNLIATHIQENNGIYDMHMLPFSLRPGWSKMNWFEIFKAFKEIEYPYPLIGECANSSGEYPLWLLEKYLKNQKELIEMFISKI